MEFIYEESLYRCVKQYTVSDIQRLLDAEIKAAGLLLMPAFAGMITFGRLFYGFDIGDKCAFESFGADYMDIEESIAELLYDNVYLGLSRQWCSYSHVLLRAFYVESPFDIEGFIAAEGERLVIDAPTFARHYIAVVNALPEASDSSAGLLMPFTESESFHQPLRDQADSVIARLGGNGE